LKGDIGPIRPGLLLADPEFLFLKSEEHNPLLDPFDLIEMFADDIAILLSNCDVFCSKLLNYRWSIHIWKKIRISVYGLVNNK
jgi:hypothetical protein